jgi:DNA-binding GntR family transcriptional regulator
VRVLQHRRVHLHLSQQYEVSTRTVERSLNTLKDEGLIVARVGRGYFVKP